MNACCRVRFAVSTVLLCMPAQLSLFVSAAVYACQCLAVPGKVLTLTWLGPVSRLLFLRSHGSILNFPPTLMTAGHLGLEASFGALEARLTSRQPMSVSSRRALRDRLFVVRLQQCAGMVPSSPAHGGAIVSPCTFAALRTGLTKMLLQRRLAFHTMQHACNSSHALYVPLPPCSRICACVL